MKRSTLLFTLTGLATVSTVQAKLPVKPNILWVMSEDQGQDLACYGMQGVKTPVLDKMASEGIIYMNAYCTNPISSPSRSAMLTGAHQTMIDAHNHRSNREKPLPKGVYPFTYYLRQNGYTCILGNHQVMDHGRKIDCNYKTEPTGPYDGVKHFGIFDKVDYFTAADQPFFNQIQLKVTHRGDWWEGISNQSTHKVDPKDVVLPPFMADVPKIRKEWACYLDQVEYMDSDMGKILKELKEKNLLDNTIIFFIGDNGRCDIRGKGYIYEPGLRVPMIVWGKGIQKAVNKELTSTTDITATILKLAGCKIPDYVIGKPLFKEDGTCASGHDYLYGARDNWDEIVECSRSIETNRYYYIRNYMPEVGWDRHQDYLEFYRPAVHVMRQLKKDGKLNSAQLAFFKDHKPVEELYDNMADPFQLHNLAEDVTYANVLNDMRSKLKDWQDNHKDCGIEDMHNRHPEIGNGVPAWLKSHHPEEWKKVTEGEINTHYHQWKDEMKK